MKNELALVSWIDYSDQGDTFLYSEIEVDSNPIISFKQRGVTISLPNLIASQSHEGEWYIYTCTCGESWCHGINDSIYVCQEEKVVYWTFKNFHSVKVFSFDLFQYSDAIETGISQIRELLDQEPNITMPKPIHQYFYPLNDK